MPFWIVGEFWQGDWMDMACNEPRRSTESFDTDLCGLKAKRIPLIKAQPSQNMFCGVNRIHTSSMTLLSGTVMKDNAADELQNSTSALKEPSGKVA